MRDSRSTGAPTGRDAGRRRAVNAEAAPQAAARKRKSRWAVVAVVALVVIVAASAAFALLRPKAGAQTSVSTAQVTRQTLRILVSGTGHYRGRRFGHRESEDQRDRQEALREPGQVGLGRRQALHDHERRRRDTAAAGEGLTASVKARALRRRSRTGPRRATRSMPPRPSSCRRSRTSTTSGASRPRLPASMTRSPWQSASSQAPRRA